MSEVKVGLRCCTTLKQLYSTLPAVRQATNLSVFSRQAPVLGDSNLYLPYSILLILTLKFGIFREKTMDLDKHLKFFLRKGKKTITSKNTRQKYAKNTLNHECRLSVLSLQSKSSPSARQQRKNTISHNGDARGCGSSSSALNL